METLKFLTSRFGEIEAEEADVIRFVGGPLGFPAHETYVVIQHKEGSPFRWMQSTTEPELAFLVTDPSGFVSDYAPQMSVAHAQELELTEETPRLVYTIVTIPKGQPDKMTMNLAGPIVINANTRRAKQIVLEDSAYEIKYSPASASTSPTEAAAA